MLIHIILRAIFIYFLISFIRGAWRTYKSFKFIKKQAENAGLGGDAFRDGFQQEKKRRPPGTSPQKDVFEAEYKVLSKDKSKDK